ncbi:MAG: hypothetical protein AB2693_26975, partial [Candidatus Thiodiazotropha sp.]
MQNRYGRKECKYNSGSNELNFSGVYQSKLHQISSEVQGSLTLHATHCILNFHKHQKNEIHFFRK